MSRVSEFRRESYFSHGEFTPHYHAATSEAQSITTTDLPELTGPTLPRERKSMQAARTRLAELRVNLLPSLARATGGHE